MLNLNPKLVPHYGAPRKIDVSTIKNRFPHKKLCGLALCLLLLVQNLFSEIRYTSTTTSAQITLTEKALADIESTMPKHPFNVYKDASEIFIFDILARRDEAKANILGTVHRSNFVKNLTVASDLNYYDFLATLAHETFHLCQMDNLGDVTKYAFFDAQDLGFILRSVEAASNLTGELAYILNVPEVKRNLSITDYRRAILPHDTFDALYNSYPKYTTRAEYIINLKSASLDYLKLFFGNTTYLDTFADSIYNGPGVNKDFYNLSEDKVLPIYLNPRYSEYQASKEIIKKAVLREVIAMLPLSVNVGDFDSFYNHAWATYIQGLRDQQTRMKERSILSTDWRLKTNLTAWGEKISDSTYQWQFIDQADEDTLNILVRKYYPRITFAQTGSRVPIKARPHGIPFTYYAGKLR
jgi:hypothetical protein